MKEIRATTQHDYVLARSSAAPERRLRRKILLLAVMPLVIACLAIALSIQRQGKTLAEQEARAMEPVLNAMKEAELRHYTELARTAIAPIYDSGRDDEATKKAVKAILNRLEFGEDGYFFVYDMQGNNLMHPRQPELVGRNLWALSDASGSPTIQRLLAKAREGGGVIPYQWERPSTHRTEQKLGYVVPLERWGWMIGTGIYLDDVAHTLDRMQQQSTRQIDANLMVIAAISVIAALLVASGGLALNISEHRLAETELRQLANQVVSSQEEERARLARELHDGVTQMLVSVKFFIESAFNRLRSTPGPDADIAPLLERGIARLNETLGEVRRISHDLRPAILDDLGLLAALDHLGREFSDRTGLAVSVSHQGSGGQWPPAVATTLFRIAQEGLGNAECHARAASVRVVTEQDPLALSLSIIDDGQGFNVDTPDLAGGIGLSNMRERVAALRGSLSIASGSHGTTVRVTIPLIPADSGATESHERST